MLNTQKRQLQSIQLLRGISVIPIFFFHQTLAGERFYSWAVWGVSAFFLISGFLGAMNGDSDERLGIMDCIKYGIHKIHRIFPLHMMMLVAAFCMWIVTNLPEITSDPVGLIPFAMVKFVLNVLLVSDWIPHLPALNTVNGEYNIVTWFLSACLLFFILTPYIRRGMHRIYDDKNPCRPYIVMLGIFAYSVIWYLLFRCIQVYEYSYWYIYECPLARLADYVMGMHLGYVFCTFKTVRIVEHKLLLWIMLAVSIFSGASLVLYATLVLNGKYNLIVSAGFYYMIPVAMMIISMVSLETIYTSDTGGNTRGIVMMLTRLGGISPYVYLCQVPVINAVHGIYKRIADVRMSVWCIISIVVTLALSEAYKLWMERERITQADA